MIITSRHSPVRLQEIQDTSMKRFDKPVTHLTILLMVAAITAIACSTTGMQRSEDVQSSLQMVDNDIKLIIVQLDAIGASLDELIKPGQADAKRAFDVYSKNVSKIEKMEKDFSNHSDKMISSSETYFKEWDKKGNTYNNPEIQIRSDQRRATLGQTYDRIYENNVGVKEAFKIYVSDVIQIEKYLSNDLTTFGIRSITSISSNAINNGDHLKNELSELQIAVENARAAMTQAGIAMEN